MLKKLTLLATDVVTLYGALAAVLLVRYGTDEWVFQWSIHTTPFSILFSVWVLSFYIANLYDPRILRNGRDFFGRLVQATVVAAVLSVVFFYLIPYFGITPRINLFLFIIAFAVLAAGTRTLANHILAAGSKKRLLIVGADEESVALARTIADNPQLGWNVRAMVHLSTGQAELGIEDTRGPWQALDDRIDLSSFIGEERIDAIVISPRTYGSADLVNTLYGALSQQVDFASLASFVERLTGTVPLGAISQQWFLENIAENSKKPYETTKRVMDIAAAIVLGIPTLAITPFVAAAIALVSPGPIFFRQRRTGRGGTPFEIVKFRTMRPDAEQRTGAVWAAENDPRVTRIGRFLRVTRIDELPQLWNILKGDMSLVGPRAERPEIDSKLAIQVPFHMERYLIKPGLSGWAQINYPYVASTQDAIRRLEHDLYYIKNRSVTLDLIIILKTISISLRRAGR